MFKIQDWTVCETYLNETCRNIVYFICSLEKLNPVSAFSSLPYCVFFPASCTWSVDWTQQGWYSLCAGRRMSSATKRKHVTREVEQEFNLPEGDQTIVKVVAGRGNNLHEVEDSTGNTFLVSMPNKFRKNVWIKRGDFVVVNPIEEGDKVKAEISTILYKDQIKYIKANNLWPTGFEKAAVVSQDLSKLNIKEAQSNSEDDSDDESDLFQNTNRPVYEESEDSDTDTESEEDWLK